MGSVRDWVLEKHRFLITMVRWWSKAIRCQEFTIHTCLILLLGLLSESYFIVNMWVTTLSSIWLIWYIYAWLQDDHFLFILLLFLMISTSAGFTGFLRSMCALDFFLLILLLLDLYALFRARVSWIDLLSMRHHMSIHIPGPPVRLLRDGDSGAQTL